MASDIQNEDNLAAANATFAAFYNLLLRGAVAVAVIVAFVIYVLTR